MPERFVRQGREGTCRNFYAGFLAAGTGQRADIHLPARIAEACGGRLDRDGAAIKKTAAGDSDLCCEASAAGWTLRKLALMRLCPVFVSESGNLAFDH
jgi:hypothetical protein